MKTQIIALEPHDDLISVRDRLSWAKTPRILLVWPKGEPIVLRPLDLKVLQRHADALGAQLGIVTRITGVRREAEALGIPVFESSAVAQREAWPARGLRRRRRRRPAKRNLRELRARLVPPEDQWQSHPMVRALAFAAGVLAVLVIAGIFVPRASITLHPQSQVQSLVIPVLASPSVEDVFVTGSVPAREEKVVVSGSQAATVTSKIIVPQAAARGVVRFHNLTQTEVSVPAGTVVHATGDTAVRFKTVNATVITPGLDQFVEVPVEAEKPGAQGNVEAGAIQGIEGSLGLLATVENLEPLTGGSDRSVIGPDQDDRSRLREALIKQLGTQAEGELRNRLPADDLLLADTRAVSQVLEESYDPPEGQAGTRLTLTARIEFSFRVVAHEDLRRLAEASLNADLPKGFSAAPGPVSFKDASKPQTGEDGVTHWQMQVQRRILRTADAARVMNLVRGRSPRTATALLSQGFQWEKAPEIDLSPAWWPWLPLIPFRTAVRVE